MQDFTLFWLDGHKETVTGKDIHEAVKLAGINSGALNAMDFWTYGKDTSYRWDALNRRWTLYADTSTKGE